MYENHQYLGISGADAAGGGRTAICQNAQKNLKDPKDGRHAGRLTFRAGVFVGSGSTRRLRYFVNNDCCRAAAASRGPALTACEHPRPPVLESRRLQIRIEAFASSETGGMESDLTSEGNREGSSLFFRDNREGSVPSETTGRILAFARQQGGSCPF